MIRTDRQSWIRIAVTLALIGALLAGLAWLLRPTTPTAVGATLTVSEAINAENADAFARATEPREFRFPQDHGPHQEYQTEWWYYTGNLESADGRHWGFQLTFFRRGLHPEIIERESAWATSNIYMAHFALTDVAGNQFYAFDRFRRDGAGLAGAQADPFRVWTGNWEASAAPDGGMRLRASEDNVALDLVARNIKPTVLQGDQGLSQKSAGEGNASYYYSFTRMATEGTITVDGQEFSVTGLSWLDREWSTSLLEETQQGWDWFALQFDDDREMMFFQIRLADGSIEPLSGGTFVDTDGSTTRITHDDVQIEVLERWTSPHSGAQYPSRWRMTSPTLGLDITIEPYLSDQELAFSVTYWEGAVRITGTRDGQPIEGNGYIEMTGYTNREQTAVDNRSP